MPEVTTDNVEYRANGATGTGFLARPTPSTRIEGGRITPRKHPGVIVIQEWWGLDDHIKDVASRLAGEGFVAVAPDLYHGAVAQEPDEARKLAMGMNREQAMKDVLGALKHLQSLSYVSPKRVGCIGFCMGGSVALGLAVASSDVAAAAPFYPGMQPPAEQLAKIDAELFCAFGAEDGGIPLEDVRKFENALRQHGKKAEVKVYAGAPHSFFNDTKPSYRADAARDAWQNTLALFRRALV